MIASSRALRDMHHPTTLLRTWVRQNHPQYTRCRWGVALRTAGSGTHCARMCCAVQDVHAPPSAGSRTCRRCRASSGCPGCVHVAC